MERAEQRRILEALVLASSEPVPATRLGRLVPECDTRGVRALVAELNQEYREQGRAFEIEEVAGGYRMRTRIELGPWIAQLRPERPLRLSQAALETLAIVAYRQPLTRAEVEDIRGVEAGPVLRTLLERRLVRIAGHREVPGRPLLYATTKRFLEVFGLGSLDDLPTLREIEDLLPAREEPEGEVVLTPEDADPGAAVAGAGPGPGDEGLAAGGGDAADEADLAPAGGSGEDGAAAPGSDAAHDALAPGAESGAAERP